MPKLGDVLIKGRGNIRSEILLLGEAGGEEEELDGHVFAGKDGKFLNSHLLKAVGLTDRDVYIDNAIPYRSVDNKGNNAQPTIVQIRQYRGHVEKLVNRMNPKVIVAMGNTPLHSLLNLYRNRDEDDEKKSQGVTGITKWRGIPVWHRQFNCWVMPALPPSRLMRGFYDPKEPHRWELNLTIEDFEKVIALSDKPLPVQTYPVYKPLRTEAQIKKILELAIQSEYAAFDIETGSLAKDSGLLGFSLSVDGKNGYFVTAGLLEKSTEVKALFKKFLTGSVVKILHNGGFDDVFLRWKGYPPLKNWVDTMNAAALVDENFPKRLKSLAWRYLNFGGYDFELEEYMRINKIKSYAEIDPSILAEYGAYDATATYQLWKIFEGVLTREQTYSLFKKVVMPTRVILNTVQVNGMKVDQEYLAELDIKCNSSKEKLLDDAFYEANQEFNPKSTKQLSEILYKKMKLRPLRVTKTGYSCDEESLLYCSKQKNGKIAQDLIDIRYLEHTQNHFLSVIKAAIEKDGRVHGYYNNAGTLTGRTSVSNPPLHNIPRDKMIRTLFIPEKGFVFVVNDIKSAELRALAAYCQDKTLLNAFRLGRDLHQETFRFMFNKAQDYTPTDDERQIGKTINFALVYMESVYGLAHQLRVSVDEAAKYMSIYFSRFPLVEKFIKDSIEFCEKHGYVKSLLGRIRHIPQIVADERKTKDHAKRMAVNSKVQGVSNDITNIAMIRLDNVYSKKNIPAMIVHNVHDSIITEVREDYADSVVALNKWSITTPVPGVEVNFDCDIDIESRWGEHKKSSRLLEIFIRTGEEKGITPTSDDEDPDYEEEDEEEEVS